MERLDETKMPRNLILAGFMGTGKTSVGRELARRLGWPFVDADDLIERRAGESIPLIFDKRGEAGFRALEREVLEELGEVERQVIATGGGAVVSEENRRLLGSCGQLVLLTAEEETIWQRVRHARHRPLLKGEDPRRKMGELLAARREAYEAIEWQVATDGKTVREIAGEIIAKIVGG